MSSDRLRFQEWIEHEIGCTDISKWDLYKNKLTSYSIDQTRIDIARNELNADAISLYTKAFISCCSGIRDVSNQQIGWGLVKLYYSLFYSSRANLCIRRQGMVRNKSWYRFDLTSTGIACIALSSKKYRNDHEAALYLYEDLYGSSDILLSNTIDNEKPYDWMMNTRNMVNYRLAHFPDPLTPPNIPSTTNTGSIISVQKTLESYMDDAQNQLTFQPEHAWLAIPFKQILKCRSEMRIRGITGTISSKQLDSIEELSNILPERANQDLELKKLLTPTD